MDSPITEVPHGPINQVFCPNCRGGNPPAGLFCMWCKSPLQTDGKHIPNQSSSHLNGKKRSNMVIIGFWMVLLVVGVLSLAYGLTPHLSPQRSSDQLTIITYPTVATNSYYPDPSAPAWEAKALMGDYQAQRNLSFSLSEGLEGYGQDIIKGCAWRIVILRSNHVEADASDINNRKVYCNYMLTKWQLTLATEQAEQLLQEIRNR